MSVDLKVGDCLIIGAEAEIYPIVDIVEQDGEKLFKLGDPVVSPTGLVRQFTPYPKDYPINVRISS